MPTEQPPKFEDALLRLDEIVHQLEEGDLGLEESLARYEEGVTNLKACYTALEQAERRIELLTGVDADGNPIAKPFEELAATAEDQVGRRAKRNKRTKEHDSGPSPTVDDEPTLF